MSDTPETSARIFGMGDGTWSVPATFARKLERERDQLRSEVAAFSSKMPCGHLRRFGAAGITSPIHCIACERDALRNILAIALQHGFTDQVRAEAKEMLKLPNEH